MGSCEIKIIIIGLTTYYAYVCASQVPSRWSVGRQGLWGFWCLELCLYDIRELANQHHGLNQSEHSISTDLDQWEVSTLLGKQSLLFLCSVLTVIVSESRKRGRNLKSRKSRNQDRDCRKEKYRDYYIEPNGCRSVKPYKMSNCVGPDNCGAIKSR